MAKCSPRDRQEFSVKLLRTLARQPNPFHERANFGLLNFTRNLVCNHL